MSSALPPIPKLLIIGAGGHGRSVAEAATLQQHYQVIGFLDDGCAPGTKVLGWSVLGMVTDVHMMTSHADAVIVAVGNNAVRERLVQQVLASGLPLATVVHPFSAVSPSAVLAPGCAVMAAAVVGTEATLGVATIVNAGAVVDHHAVVDEFGHLGVGAVMAGGTRLGRAAWLQPGCALGYGVSIAAGQVSSPGTAFGQI